MRFGYVMTAGEAADAAVLAEAAEQAGWDGFFCYEPTWGIDAWVCLAAAALRTSRIRLGTMLTPLPKRRPWEVASQIITVDRLSQGRVILSVGLGADEPRFWMFEDDPGRRVRAEQLDEGLELIALMQRGEAFDYQGRHFHAHRPEIMIPPPAHQRPHVTTWVVGLWPAPRSMRRVARWDGWLPNFRQPEGLNRPDVEQLAEGVAWLRTQRARLAVSPAGLAGTDAGGFKAAGSDRAGFDVVAEGTYGDDPGPWQAAGATWWIEGNWTQPEAQSVSWCLDRLREGPPRS